MAPPPSVRSFFSRNRVSKKEIGLDDRKITDDDILASIDDIYMQTKGLLLKENYSSVIGTFLFLTEYDILFKKIISSQLTNIKGDFLDAGMLNEDIMSFIVMIQSYFNSFRINLLSDVVEYLYDEYRETMNQMHISYSLSLKRFNRANNCMMYIINKLKAWYAPHTGDYFYDLLFQESKESFLELKLHAARQLQKLINKQLHLLH